MDTNKLADRCEIGQKHILKIEVWRNQAILSKLRVMLNNDKEVSFDEFEEATCRQLWTFIVYASEEKNLTPYREILVRKNRYGDD